MSLGLLAFLTNLTAYMRTRFVLVGLRARAAASSSEDVGS
jgi:hypothetical protein